jgi:hypothetical protein
LKTQVSVSAVEVVVVGVVVLVVVVACLLVLPKYMLPQFLKHGFKSPCGPVNVTNDNLSSSHSSSCFKSLLRISNMQSEAVNATAARIFRMLLPTVSGKSQKQLRAATRSIVSG